MKPRIRPTLSLLALMGILLAWGPTFAAQPASPDAAAAFGFSAVPHITWAGGPSSPFLGTRFDGEYVASLRRAYFLGFRVSSGSGTTQVTDGSIWYLDLASQTYVDTTLDMPVPVSNYQIAALTDATGLGLYIFGGRDANAQIITTVQVYYPTLNTTSVISSDPWPGQTLPGCVSLPAMGVATVANRAIVMGGMSFAANGCVDSQSSQTWIFDPNAPAGSRWTPGPSLNVARGYITPAVIGGKVYAIGGDTIASGILSAVPTVEAWQSPRGAWDDGSIADLPQACDESQAFAFASGALAPGIVLAGCGQWPNAVPNVYYYSAAANTWSDAGTLDKTRRNQAGVLINTPTSTTMYVLGGYGEDSGFLDSIHTSELSSPKSQALTADRSEQAPQRLAAPAGGVPTY